MADCRKSKIKRDKQSLNDYMPHGNQVECKLAISQKVRCKRLYSISLKHKKANCEKVKHQNAEHLKVNHQLMIKCKFFALALDQL